MRESLETCELMGFNHVSHWEKPNQYQNKRSLAQGHKQDSLSHDIIENLEAMSITK